MASDVSSGEASSGGGTATRPPEPDTGFEQRRPESLGLRIQHVLHARFFEGHQRVTGGIGIGIERLQLRPSAVVALLA